jgi:triacylglycerol lipase
MAERLWRCVVFSVLGGALLVAVTNLERPWMATMCALLILGLHGVVLGIEFTVASVTATGAPVPRARFFERLTAWWEEVRVDARMFGLEQAFRRARHPAERLAPGRGRGVVFVHGFFCNRAVWHPWIDCLDADTPYVAVETTGLLRSIDDGIDTLDAAVASLEAATGLNPVIVAHSMGGLWVRAWLDAEGADSRIEHVITVATPHGGTRFARLGFGENVRQMQVGSAWLATLRHREPATRAALFTCFYGRCDNVVVPAVNATLAGADNRHLAGAAHLAMLYRPLVFAEVMSRLRSASAKDVRRRCRAAAPASAPAPD